MADLLLRGPGEGGGLLAGGSGLGGLGSLAWKIWWSAFGALSVGGAGHVFSSFSAGDFLSRTAGEGGAESADSDAGSEAGTAGRGYGSALEEHGVQSRMAFGVGLLMGGLYGSNRVLSRDL